MDKHEDFTRGWEKGIEWGPSALKFIAVFALVIFGVFLLFLLYRLFKRYLRKHRFVAYCSDEDFPPVAIVLAERLARASGESDWVEFLKKPGKVMHQLDTFLEEQGLDGLDHRLKPAVKFFREYYQPIIEKMQQEEMKAKEEAMASEPVPSTIATQLEQDSFVMVYAPAYEYYYIGSVLKENADTKLVLEVRENEKNRLEVFDTIEGSFLDTEKGLGSFFGQVKGVEGSIVSVDADLSVSFDAKGKLTSRFSLPVRAVACGKDVQSEKIDRNDFDWQDGELLRLGLENVAVSVQADPSPAEFVLVDFFQSKADYNPVRFRLKSVHGLKDGKHLLVGVFPGSEEDRYISLANALAVTRRENPDNNGE